MVCVSDETAPNWSNNSRIVSAMSVSGTGCPSLNFSGSSTSNRRSGLVIAGVSFDGERYALACETGHRRFRHQGIAARDQLEREPAGKITNGLPLRIGVWKAKFDHTWDYIPNPGIMQPEFDSTGQKLVCRH